MAEVYNLIAVSFEEPSKAYQALSVLRNVDAAGGIELLSAGIVERDLSGVLRWPEGTDAITGSDTLGGGLVGMLVGVLGGPVGMLIGFGAGALVGGAIDLRRATHGDELLAQFSRAIPPGGTALVAEVNEPAVEVIDREMAKLGGAVVRRPAAEVRDELEAAEDAAKAAEREARKEVCEHKKADRKEKLEERKAKLREKLGLS